MYSIGILFVPIFCRLMCFYFTRKDNKSTYIILYMLTNEFINLQHLSKITVFTLKNLYSRYQ